MVFKNYTGSYSIYVAVEAQVVFECVQYSVFDYHNLYTKSSL